MVDEKEDVVTCILCLRKTKISAIRQDTFGIPDKWTCGCKTWGACDQRQCSKYSKRKREVASSGDGKRRKSVPAKFK